MHTCDLHCNPTIPPQYQQYDGNYFQFQLHQLPFLVSLNGMENKQPLKIDLSNIKLFPLFFKKENKF